MATYFAIRSISFNPAMLWRPCRAGRKVRNRRRLPQLAMRRQPDRYRFVGLSARGAV
jgi:hypothetical protein